MMGKFNFSQKTLTTLPTRDENFSAKRELKIPEKNGLNGQVGAVFVSLHDKTHPKN